jgi:NADP-dependent 3-hydroxy acid dehydrogenase YdfG
VDILCANAGMFPQATLNEMDRRTWDDMLKRRLLRTFHFSALARLKILAMPLLS